MRPDPIALLGAGLVSYCLELPAALFVDRWSPIPLCAIGSALIVRSVYLRRNPQQTFAEIEARSFEMERETGLLFDGPPASWATRLLPGYYEERSGAEVAVALPGGDTVHIHKRCLLRDDGVLCDLDGQPLDLPLSLDEGIDLLGAKIRGTYAIPPPQVAPPRIESCECERCGGGGMVGGFGRPVKTCPECRGFRRSLQLRVAPE